ncbi:MAG: RDD family protein [Candidatus Methylacidiphilaceae bacterium]
MVQHYWRRRLTADLIDAFGAYFSALVLFQLEGFAAAYYLSGHHAAIPTFRSIALPAAFLVGPWAYFALLERSSHGGAQGKIWLNLRVFTSEGEPVNLARATFRHGCRIAAAVVALWPLALSGSKIPSVVHWVGLALSLPAAFWLYYRFVDRISGTQVAPREYPPPSFRG